MTTSTGTQAYFSRFPKGVIVLWLLILLSVALDAILSKPGWDLAVYSNAIHSLQAHHDPYLDDIALKEIYHHKPVNPAEDPPFSYMYSPLTIPFLRVIGTVPAWLSGPIYWVIYSLGVLGAIWFAMCFAEGKERKWLLYLAPVTVFFPGLLANGIVLGGNVAYILYAAVLLTAMLGWRRNNWKWFYFAVLAASCVKAPLLSLVLIPLLSARKQWIPTAVTVLAGVSLFALNPIIWPDYFKHYLQTVDLQLRYNRDFGCSPAGLLSQILYDRGIAYSPACIIFYLTYAIPVFALLAYFSRQFFAGAFSFKQWVPVLIVGVILLNPRLIEYDLATITLLLAMIIWRFLKMLTPPPENRSLSWTYLHFPQLHHVEEWP